jgi:hypothetical protein
MAVGQTAVDGVWWRVHGDVESGVMRISENSISIDFVLAFTSSFNLKIRMSTWLNMIH